MLHDKDEVRLGGVTIVAYRTPGHTPGNTTYVWKESQSGTTYSVVLAGSLSSNARTLSDPPISTLVEDYRYTFRLLRGLPCDIYLGSHGKFFDLSEKYAALQKGEPTLTLTPRDTKRTSN